MPNKWSLQHMDLEGFKWLSDYYNLTNETEFNGCSKDIIDNTTDAAVVEHCSAVVMNYLQLMSKSDTITHARKLLWELIVDENGASPGTYVNEADFFQPNWRETFWGENYARLLKIKQKLDPNQIFNCHH